MSILEFSSSFPFLSLSSFMNSSPVEMTKLPFPWKGLGGSIDTSLKSYNIKPLNHFWLSCCWRKMSGAVLVAIGATIGNLLQGWDNATIAGKSFSSSSYVFAMHVWTWMYILTRRLLFRISHILRGLDWFVVHTFISTAQFILFKFYISKYASTFFQILYSFITACFSPYFVVET